MYVGNRRRIGLWQEHIGQDHRRLGIAYQWQAKILRLRYPSPGSEARREAR